jgi:hypothetical protein
MQVLRKSDGRSWKRRKQPCKFDAGLASSGRSGPKPSPYSDYFKLLDVIACDANF